MSKQSPPQRKLTAYIMTGHTVFMRPGEAAREWMDETPESYAYRCLPLTVANMHGWEVLCPAPFRCIWDGGIGREAIRIEGGDAHASLLPVSHFGSGVLTFHVNALMRTDDNINMMAMGPINRPKHGIAPLAGVIETDWSPYTFTMNWMFTAPGIWVEFEKGEPFCHLMPLERGFVESFVPVAKTIDDDPALKAEHDAWQVSRNQFNEDLMKPGSEAAKEKWQKLYYRGLRADGTEFPKHQIKLRVKPFRNK
jgi:hypothetical protein